MTPNRLLLRSVFYYSGINAAVVMGVAVGVAVLTGALLVGDSMKGSLRSLALDRLGNIDQVLVTDRYFREALADDLLRTDSSNILIDKAAPAIFTRGVTENPITGARASQVNIYAVDERFLTFFDSRIFLPNNRQVILNQNLAHEIGVEIGDSLLLRFQEDTSIPRESVMGRRDENVRTLRLEVSAVLGDRGMGGFGLLANQQVPQNIFLPLSVLQRTLGKEGRVNTILVTEKKLSNHTNNLDDYRLNTVGLSPPSLNELLKTTLKLDDFDLKITTVNDRLIVLESNRVFLEASSAVAVHSAAEAERMSTVPVLTYLLNRTTISERSFPYSTVTSLGCGDAGLRDLQLIDGRSAPSLKLNEIFLNEWAAKDLQASVGDSLTLEYYVVSPQGTLDTKQYQLKVKGVLKLEGLAVDRHLAPEYEGIAEAENIVDWDPPFPVDLSLIRKIDEEYWNRYRATPKAFVSLEQAKELWTSRFGQLTSIRIVVPEERSITKAAMDFDAELREHLRPMDYGLVFQPVREEALTASDGATDFSTLFIGFSIFLIVSAAILVVLLFQLGVERRSHEIGLLLAIGQTVSVVRRLLLKEALLFTVAGCLIGIPGAIGYGVLMVHGLNTWWSGAVGGSFLELYVKTESLAIGAGSTFCLMVAAIGISARKFTHLSSPLMLSGHTADPLPKEVRAAGSRMKRTAWGFTGLALLLFAVGLTRGGAFAAEVFFGVGALLMISILIYFRYHLLRPLSKMITEIDAIAIIRLGVRNGARYPTRSVLSAALIASATFVITTVAMSRNDVTVQSPSFFSGDGGFHWIAESALPLYENQFEDFFESSSDDGEVVLLRSMAGEDASCLNLYRPLTPKLLGAPEKMISRGGFAFDQTLARTPEEIENPWLLLNNKTVEGAIPVFGDANSVMWILHLGLGQNLEIEDELGRTRKLFIVGLFSRSIFQSQLITSEKHFLEMFPGKSGYNQFLIETDSTDVGALLETTFSDQGFDAVTTSNRLADYIIVENTYLNTFQILGGLGLLLGTLGLAVVMVRNILERRRELALLRAVGFTDYSIAWLVLAENGFLLVFGVLTGFVAALLAISPHLLGGSAEPPWISLTATLVAIVLVGLSAGVFSVAMALRAPLITSLREK